MKTTSHSFSSKTTQQHIKIVAIFLAGFTGLAFANARATLPPEPPKGVSVLNSNGRALRTGILTNCSVDMISLIADWDLLEPTEGTYHWTESIDKDLNTINSYGKTVLLRINTMGGCPPTGKIPPWVFTAMGITARSGSRCH
jgi:hypothetical protein